MKRRMTVSKSAAYDNLEQSNIDVPTLNGLVIAHLIELEAAESIDAIRKAFNSGNVDITVAGDLEDVEIELGLREKRETPQPNYLNPEFEKLTNIFDSFTAKKKKIGRNAPCPCGSGKNTKNAVWIKIFENPFHCQGYIRYIKSNEFNIRKMIDCQSEFIIILMCSKSFA